MRGHEALIAMRRQGAKPRRVTLLTTPGYDRWVATWPTEFPAYPDIEIAPEDTPERLDLRFLVGLQVHVDGADETRVERVTRCAVAAGAARVIGSVFREVGARTELIRMTDTQGDLTWQS